jgi:Xaa-Pro aminopeptidase
MFSPETYTARRATLASRFDSGLLLFPGNAESPANFADNCFTFRQDSTFLYFFGLDQPDLTALIDVDAGTTTIYGRELTMDDIIWMGDLPTLAERAVEVGVARTQPPKDLADAIAKARSAGRPVHYLPPYRAATVLALADLMGVSPSEAREGFSVDLIKAVVAQRNYKSPEEVAEIEKAIAISVSMHEAAMRMARPGVTEQQIAGRVEGLALELGGRTSFPVIATVKGQTLHQHAHPNTLSAGDLFLLDSGAETLTGYAGDLTSTFPVSPNLDDRQKTIYDLVLSAYEASVEALAPGVTNRDIHFTACRVLIEGMKSLGVMKGDTEEALAAGAAGMIMPHGIGHMMGMDVHDMENLGEQYVGYTGEPRSTQLGLKSLRLVRALEPGFVLTIEPGVYFIPQLMDRWRSEGHLTQFIDYDELDKWRGFGGVRNEEDYLITADGARRLGPRKPQTPEEIASVRNG